MGRSLGLSATTVCTIANDKIAATCSSSMKSNRGGLIIAQNSVLATAKRCSKNSRRALEFERNRDLCAENVAALATSSPNESLVGEVGAQELSARKQPNNSKAAQTLYHASRSCQDFFRRTVDVTLSCRSPKAG